MRERGYRPRTLGADRGYDTQDCVRDIRARRVTPHVAQKKKHSAIDGRTTRPAGYAVSLRIRKLLTVLNAVSRDQVPWQTEPLSTAIHT